MTRPSPDARVRLPGTRLLAFAGLWFDERTVRTVLEPLVADWQRQWDDATPAQRRWINAKGFAAFAATTVMMTPRLALSTAALRARPLVVGGGFWAATSIILTALVASSAAAEGMTPWSYWLLLPASLTVMLPFAILPALDAMRRDGEGSTAADRRGALMLVAVAVCSVAIGQGWLTPAANQRWRIQTMSELNGRSTVPMRGIREVTTSELIAGDVAIIPALTGTPRVRELNMRLSLALLPAVLGWLRWQSLSRRQTRAWRGLKSCLLAIAAAAAFIAIMPAARSLEFVFYAPGFGPTLALAVFAAIARTGIWLRQRAGRSLDRSADHASTSS